MVASVGRYVMRNFMFLYSISAGSGLRTFMAFDDDEDVIASASETMTQTDTDKRTLNRCTGRTMTRLLLLTRRHWTEKKWAMKLNSAKTDDKFTDDVSVRFKAGTRTPTAAKWSVIYIVKISGSSTPPVSAPDHRDRTARFDTKNKLSELTTRVPTEL